MAEQSTELRRINWTECCPFTHLFRTFRMAIHPSKLGLALVGILLTGFWGIVLDAVWSSNSKPVAGELDVYWRTSDVDAWRAAEKKRQAAELQTLARQAGVLTDQNVYDRFMDKPSKATDDVLRAIRDRGSRAGDLAAIDAGLSDHVRSMRQRGVFASFASYEAGVIRQALEAASSLNFAGGWTEVLSAQRSGHPDLPVPAVSTRGVGVLGCMVLLIRGKQWLVIEHPLYTILFGVVALGVWSLIGGAICRIAALNIARDERLSPRAALDFARRKFLGFFTAPLLPVGMVVGIGILIFVFGLLMWIPWLGEVVGGLGMVLPLLGGFVMALVIIGGLAGGNLMWPTIAIEGSDSFDAMSRGYSYVYSKPWRAAFYAVVTFVYGAVCYLFLRLFVLVMLKATRFFVGLGLLWTSRPRTGIPGATKIDTLWPYPTFNNLRGSAVPFGMEHWEPLGAWLICVWVLLVTALLWAFLVSFYFCGSSLIYCLLRREVDATDMEDVYLEEDDTEHAVPTPAEPPVIVPPASPPSAPPPGNVLGESPGTA